MSSKVVKAGVGYTIGNYLLKGLTFLTLPVFSRLLSTDDFGDYSVFISYETILFIVLGFALHSSYKSAKYRYEENSSDSSLSYSKYVSATILLIAISGCVWLVIVNIIYSLIPGFLGMERVSINLLVVFSYSTAVITCFNSNASLNYKYSSYLLITGINAVLNTVISIVLLLTVFSSNRYLGRVIGTVLPAFIIAIVISVNFFKRSKPEKVGLYLKWGIAYSFPIIFHGISQVILSQFDRIMIKEIDGSYDAGIYSFAYNIFMIISITSTSLDNVWGTWAYSKINGNDFNSIKKYSNYYIMGLFVFSILIMLISPELIMFLGGQKYTASKYVVLPIITAGFFSFLYTIPATAEYYSEKTKYIAFSTICAAIMNIVLNTIFINKYGYVAAAYTTLATYVLYFLFHWLIARRIMPDYKIPLQTILITSISILVSNFVILLIIDNIFIRLVLFVIITMVSLLFEERKFGYLKKIKKRGV